MNKRAFTLPELLVVLAIIVILASVLFPVFVSARESARRTACASNFRSAGTATLLYLQDYDSLYMPTNYQTGTVSSSLTDRTWVQLVMPYVNTYSIFKCPSDNTDRPRREATFDEDLVPGDTYSQYYTASQRTNIGYNYLYFAPFIRTGGDWVSNPRTDGQIDSPAETVLFVDSVWTKPSASQFPSGGGSFVVIPPCRFVEGEAGAKLDTFNNNSTAINDVFTDGTSGWQFGQQPSPLKWGGAWPWHNGMVTTLMADNHTKPMKPDGLTIGCEPLPNWEGFIRDHDKYMWDLR